MVNMDCVYHTHCVDNAYLYNPKNVTNSPSGSCYQHRPGPSSIPSYKIHITSTLIIYVNYLQKLLRKTTSKLAEELKAFISHVFA